MRQFIGLLPSPIPFHTSHRIVPRLSKRRELCKTVQVFYTGTLHSVSLYGSVFCSESLLVLARNILAARARMPLFGTTLLRRLSSDQPLPTPLAFLITCLSCKSLPLLRTTLPPPPASLPSNPQMPSFFFWFIFVDHLKPSMYANTCQSAWRNGLSVTVANNLGKLWSIWRNLRKLCRRRLPLDSTDPGLPTETVMASVRGREAGGVCILTAKGSCIWTNLCLLRFEAGFSTCNVSLLVQPYFQSILKYSKGQYFLPAACEWRNIALDCHFTTHVWEGEGG